MVVSETAAIICDVAQNGVLLLLLCLLNVILIAFRNCRNIFYISCKLLTSDFLQNISS